MIFAFVLALAVSGTAVLGRLAPTEVRLEETDIRAQTGESTGMVVGGFGDNNGRSTDLKYVKAIRNSSMWTEVKRRSLTVSTADRRTRDIMEAAPESLSDGDLATLKRACHDGLKCVAVDQLLALKSAEVPPQTGSGGFGNATVRRAITKITRVLTEYTTESHGEYQYEEVTESDDPSAVTRSVTVIVEDNAELCGPVGRGGDGVFPVRRRVKAFPSKPSDKEVPVSPRAKATSGDRIPPITNNGLLNFGTINNYNINNGNINSATINGQAPDTVTVNGSAAIRPGGTPPQVSGTKVQRVRPSGADTAGKVSRKPKTPETAHNESEDPQLSAIKAAIVSADAISSVGDKFSVEGDSYKRKIPETVHNSSRVATPSGIKTPIVGARFRQVLGNGEKSSVGSDSHKQKTPETEHNVAKNARLSSNKAAFKSASEVLGSGEKYSGGGDSHRPKIPETVHNHAMEARLSAIESPLRGARVASSGESKVSDNDHKPSVSGGSHKLQTSETVHSGSRDAQLSAIKAAIGGADASEVSDNGNMFLVGDDSHRPKTRETEHNVAMKDAQLNNMKETFGDAGAVSSGTGAVSGGGRKSSVDGVPHKHKKLEAAHNGGKKIHTGTRNARLGEVDDDDDDEVTFGGDKSSVNVDSHGRKNPEPIHNGARGSPADGSVGKSHLPPPPNSIATNTGKSTSIKSSSKPNKATSTNASDRVNDSTNTLNFKSGNRNTGNVKNNYVTVATGNGGGGNGQKKGGENDTDTDILSVGTNNYSNVRKGYVEDGVLNNNKMLTVDVNAGSRIKGLVSNADAREGIINVGTLNNGPTNFGTSDNTTNHGRVTNMNSYDAQMLAAKIDQMYSTILKGFAG